MNIFKHELKSGMISLIIWTGVVAFLLALCILIYPQMTTQMEEISNSFSQMGGFSEAFEMDKINFGEFIGFFSIECGNVLGLEAHFAALLGISILAKEEKDHTAEFLLSHPQSRVKIITEKLAAVFVQIMIFNIIAVAVSAVSIKFIDESPDLKKITLIFIAYFVLQIEIAAICFGISAFLRRSGVGIGLGIATIFYFLNIIANLTEDAEFLKYITPFGYANGSDIIVNNSINCEYIIVGIVFAIVGILMGYIKYTKKDIIA